MSDQITPQDLTLPAPGGATFVRDFVFTAPAPQGGTAPDWTGATARATLKRPGSAGTVLADLHSGDTPTAAGSALLVVSGAPAAITLRLTVGALDTAAIGQGGRVITDLHAITTAGVVQRLLRLTLTSDGNYTTV